ncbi:hypothetical protein SARC_13356, partial [Sphaeroforma arctica JP610]
MTGPETRPLPTVGKQVCDRLLRWFIETISQSTELCDKVNTARAKKPALKDDEKVGIYLKLTRLLLEAQYSIQTLSRLRHGHFNTLMHEQEAKEKNRLIQEQLRQLHELSLADIDMSMPQDTAQATVDDDFSETQAEPAMQQHWAPCK